MTPPASRERNDIYVDLEIEHDLRFQRGDWMVQRVGGAFFALIILAAMAGVLGGGPLSRASLRAHGVELEYDRFARWEAPLTFRIRIEPQSSHEARLWLDREHLAMYRIDAITPEPLAQEARGDRIVFVFATPAADAAPLLVTLHVTNERFGIARGGIGLEGREGASFRQIIYP